MLKERGLNHKNIETAMISKNLVMDGTMKIKLFFFTRHHYQIAHENWDFNYWPLSHPCKTTSQKLKKLGLY